MSWDAEKEKKIKRIMEKGYSASQIASKKLAMVNKKCSNW